MAILVLKHGVSTAIHPDQIDSEDNVEEVALKKYTTRFGHGSSEPSVYAVDMNNSVMKLTKVNSKISYTT
ncbi:hypothetical protein GGI09_006600, partial [Coemansia sp. S100]